MRAVTRVEGTCTSLHLLGRFQLTVDGEARAVGRAPSRLLALLALADGEVGRHRAAGNLWPETDERHAQGSLRSALWQLRRTGGALVVSTATHLRLAPRVAVDVSRVMADALALRRDGTVSEPLRLGELVRDELLPGWDEGWLEIERERLRQVRLDAAERLVDRLCVEGAHAEAIDLALWLVAEAPLRETAHRALVRAHVAAGNRGEAQAHLRALTARFRRELGIEPSPILSRLLLPDLAVTER